MNYLIPANAKKGTLIFGLFNRFDLILFGIGVIVTVLLLIIISPESLATALICLTPLLVCTFLVVPIPNYHNMMCVLQNIYKFYFVERRTFKWRGLCAKDEFK